MIVAAMHHVFADQTALSDRHVGLVTLRPAESPQLFGSAGA